MLTRRREQIFVLLALIALNLSGVWYMRRLRKAYQSRTEWVYAPVQSETGPRAAWAPSTPLQAQSFSEIVTRNMFLPERTNESPADKAVAPELPYLFGTMNLGEGAFALMAPGNESSAVSKKVLPGEEVGGYKLVSIGSSQVVVEWGEKKVTIDVSESARRVPRVIDRTPRAENARPAAAGAPPGSSQHVTTVGQPSNSSTSASDEFKRKFTAAGYNAPPGAPVDAPAGTIFGGKEKVVVHSPFGDSVYWKDAGQATATTGTETGKKEQ